MLSTKIPWSWTHYYISRPKFDEYFIFSIHLSIFRMELSFIHDALNMD